MKQHFFKSLLVAALVLSCGLMVEAKPYKYSVGIVTGMQIGPSAKFLLGKNHHFAYMHELSYAYTVTAGSGIKFNMNNMMGGMGFAPARRAGIQDIIDQLGGGGEMIDPSGEGEGSWDELMGGGGGSSTVMWEDFCYRTNMAYQGKAVSGKGIDLDWYVGGGLSLGAMITHGTGAGGKFGLNAIGGIEINMSNAPIAVSFDFRPGYGVLFYSMSGTIGIQHVFDWQLALGVRYTI